MLCVTLLKHQNNFHAPYIDRTAHASQSGTFARRTKPSAQKPTLQKSLPAHLTHFGTLLLTITLAWTQVNGQQPIKYDFFNKQPLGQIQIAPPQPFQFTPVDVNNFSAKQNANFPIQPNPLLAGQSSIEQQNRQILQQHNMLPGPTNARQVQQMAEVERDLMETEFYRKHVEWMNKTQSYKQAFNALAQLNPDSFSLTKAMFLVENAFLDSKLSYEQFQNAIKLRAQHVKQILKRENLNAKNDIALNYGIQKLFSQANAYYNSKTKQTVNIPPFKYDFEDFRGEKDYTKMFVYKMLATGKGQCHSMPLMYLMVAEQLGAKAWLSLAPQHSFIQFEDNNGKLMNFETTNGSLVSSIWLAQSGYINSKAVKNNTYLDTLSTKQLYAQSLSGLLLGYLHKFDYDDFAEQIRQKILQVNPNNLTA